MVVPALACWPEQALKLIASPLKKKNSRQRRAAIRALIELASEIDSEEIEDVTLSLLEDSNENTQQLALEVVARMKSPPDDLIDYVADLSSQPGAIRALLRFRPELVKGELRSLIKSRNKEERFTGLEIARGYGQSAAEFATLIAEGLASDETPTTSNAAITALVTVLPYYQLQSTLEPALDHWNKDVQSVAQKALKAANITARKSAWNGHPFPESLFKQLHRLGFKPTDSLTPPTNRPVNLQGRAVQFRAKCKKTALTTFQLSPVIWTLLNRLSTPGGLFTVWGSGYSDYQNTDTFYFSEESELFVYGNGNSQQVFEVIGDGSIGYFAAIDLRSTSNDPAVYYLSRWAGWDNDAHWQQSRSLSDYLRTLGDRRGQ